MTNTKRSDEVYLEEIENLSKKISDLINIGKYEDITVIDKKRLELIKNFNDHNNKQFQRIITRIDSDNLKNIEKIEKDYKNLKAERSSFSKRLKAYNH
jgi:Txe/YoeB family toxin of Txe-Axe toxin-antitoxin module